MKHNICIADNMIYRNHGVIAANTYGPANKNSKQNENFATIYIKIFTNQYSNGSLLAISSHHMNFKKMKVII